MVSLCGRGFDSHQVHFLISKEIFSNRKGSIEAWFETAFFNSIIIEPISDSSQKRSKKLLKREELITPYYHNKFNFVLLSHLTFLITALSLNALTHHFEWQKWQEISFLSNYSFGAVTESNTFLPNNSPYKASIIYAAVALSDAQDASPFFASFAHHTLPYMLLLSLIRKEDNRFQL